VTRLSIGVMLSTGRTSPDEIAPRARHVEALGLDALFVGDHLAAAVPVMDSTVTLAAVAASTTRIRLGFGVMVLPLRHPAWAAKQVATLQRLSGGRVILGVGVGGEPHGTAAFEAVGVPFAERGRRTDAALEVLPGLISGKPTLLPSGASITLEPGAEVPPIWVGGGSASALRRAAEHADAWFPSQVLAGWVEEGARRMAELAAERGRPRPGVAVGGSVLLGGSGTSPALDAHVAALTGMYGLPPEVAASVPITGSPARAAERFAEYARAGAEHLVLGIVGEDWLRQCELIAETRALLD
jgi:alkanesulfonate monooxygenase SsuD/methylene tetrahydromethanopterin reductase-like flavin-dependent oxidoreductase (luciferase family)